MDIDFSQLAATCAPRVASETIAAIVRKESAFDPIALHVNGAKLERRPNSLPEAIAWANELVARGFSVDVGLAQINSRNFGRLGLTAERAFDPCTNLQAAQTILAERYTAAAGEVGEGQEALGMALSAYNTGSMDAGYSNGYVESVAANAGIAGLPHVPKITTAAAVAPSAAVASTATLNTSNSNPLIVFIRTGSIAANDQAMEQQVPIHLQP